MKLYSVKQASRLLKLSTNTVYKYLDEGIIKATRSGPKGRFRITKGALEEYVGVKLPSLKSYTTIETNQPHHSPPDSSLTPTLGIKIARVTLIILLLLFVSDLYFNPHFSLTTQIVRICLALLLTLLIYQFGGVKRPRSS